MYFLIENDKRANFNNSYAWKYFMFSDFSIFWNLKGCRMGRSDKVSLWYVALLINTKFRFFILE